MSTPRGNLMESDETERRAEASGVGRVARRSTTNTTAASASTKAGFVAQLTSTTPDMEDNTRSTRLKVLGIHHIKFAVSNLDVSIAWYERVLGARRVPALDHVTAEGSRFAAVCEMVDWSGLFLELRQNESQAQKEKGWDPITLSVRGKEDLVKWINWLDRWGTTHSPLLTGMRGWLLVFEDPDGRRIRMYTKEQHGGTEDVSKDDPWLNEP